MIVKIQIPLATNATRPQALIYNQNRTFLTEVDAEEVKDWMKGDYRAFFELQMVDYGRGWKIVERLPEQGW